MKARELIFTAEIELDVRPARNAPQRRGRLAGNGDRRAHLRGAVAVRLGVVIVRLGEGRGDETAAEIAVVLEVEIELAGVPQEYAAQELRGLPRLACLAGEELDGVMDADVRLVATAFDDRLASRRVVAGGGEEECS